MGGTALKPQPCSGSPGREGRVFSSLLLSAACFASLGRYGFSQAQKIPERFGSGVFFFFYFYRHTELHRGES